MSGNTWRGTRLSNAGVSPAGGPRWRLGGTLLVESKSTTCRFGQVVDIKHNKSLLIHLLGIDEPYQCL
ncbi:hypothetical protein P3606_24605, partial [Vibrio parahaemolyticus]|nr:hypothetical protein [Vibrio parahaemolyticus]